MFFIFQGGNELVKLNIDRADKRVWVASSKTNYRNTETSWRQLFDKGKERFQEKVTDKLTDEEFKQLIIAQMAQVGYNLKKSD